MLFSETIPSPPTHARTLAQRERAAQRFWLAGIIGFFVLQALLWVVAIWLTSGDNSFAVHPDYEARAERWDASREALRASAQLGWQVRVEAPAERSSEPGSLLIKVVDAKGTPVAGATCQLSIFHQARAAQVQVLQLTETSPGVYLATATLDRAGLWKLAGTIVREQDTLFIDQSLSL